MPAGGSAPGAPPTTFVRAADAATFEELVQRLTAGFPHGPHRHHRPPSPPTSAPATGSPASAGAGSPPSGPGAIFLPASPSASPGASLSTEFAGLCIRAAAAHELDEEEKAVVEKRFYLRPSSEPVLLPLFPLSPN